MIVLSKIRLQKIYLLKLSVLFACFSGCFNQSAKPLDNSDISRMGNSKISTAWIDYQDGTQISIAKDELNRMNVLLRLLGPIGDTAVGELQNPELTLNYQSGMSPTSLQIDFSNERLRFSLSPFVYEGGNSKSFLDQLESFFADDNIKDRGQKLGAKGQKVREQQTGKVIFD